MHEIPELHKAIAELADASDELISCQSKTQAARVAEMEAQLRLLEAQAAMESIVTLLKKRAMDGEPYRQ